jgi:predicted RNA polymerase sigma factor
VTGLTRIEDLLRVLAPQVLGVLVGRFGDFDACEDAVQEALLSAATHWPKEGIPDNRAIAAAMVYGPAEGLRLLETLDDRLPRHHRLDAVRAHLFEMAGDLGQAVAHYEAAASRTTSLPEKRYLIVQAARVRQRSGAGQQ